MIARIWRGAVRAEDAAAYAEYVQRTGIEGYKGTPGNRGAWLLSRTVGDRAEFITVSFWDSREAGRCAFPRKRLVKACTKRLRGNVAAVGRRGGQVAG